MHGQPDEPNRVLLLSSENSAAAQLAAGLLRGLVGDRFVASIAEAQPSVVDRRATLALAELGLDNAEWVPRSLDHYRAERFDTVITVCATGCET